MIPALKKIVELEGIKCELGVLEKITENANGDLRSAINDLQAIAQGKTVLKIDDIVTGERDSKENIFKVLVKILKGTNIREAHEATFHLDENPDDLIQWMDENLPLEYTSPDDLSKGYYYLGRASVFLGRVKRRQNYNMWRYASVLMTAGVIVARSHRYGGFVKYQPPSLWRKLGQTKGMRQVRDSTAKKIGTYCHVSMSFTRSQLFPFFKLLIANEKYAPNITAALGFEPEELAFLLDSKSVTKKVQKIYDGAQSLKDKETESDVELFGGFGSKDNKTLTLESQKIKPESETEISKPEQKKPDIPVKKEGKSQSSLFDF
jgi:replication factor C large subunit